jgi:hypothetical protein
MRVVEYILLMLLSGAGPAAAEQPILDEHAINQPRGGLGSIAPDVLPRQNTGGDKKIKTESGKKGHRTVMAVAPGLNPQPLPPGRHPYRRRRRHRVKPNALTVKQK